MIKVTDCHSAFIAESSQKIINYNWITGQVRDDN